MQGFLVCCMSFAQFLNGCIKQQAAGREASSCIARRVRVTRGDNVGLGRCVFTACYGVAGMLRLRAARDIAAGEQLCIAYLDVDLPVERRQEKLSFGYGFTCACPRCLEEL